MSLDVTQRIWAEAKAEGSALTVLLAIGDYANAQGEAWPSVGSLAQKVRMSERAVQRLAGELIRLGDLRVEFGTGRGNRNRYVVTVGGGERVTDEEAAEAK